MTTTDNPAGNKMNGWLALSPLAVFLATYLVTSIICGDFYKVPVASAFLLASIYAFIISPGSISKRISTFSAGAGDKNVLLMIWIFIMAGAFAASAKAIGSVEATVNLTLRILPGKLILAGLFIAACFISMSIGTSVGTIVALVPIASGISSQADISLPMITALIVGGAFFGDNLSFISDTTIASTTSQGCTMSDKFKANIWIAGPAALAVTVFYVFIGLNLNVHPEIGEISVVKLIPYLSVIILAIMGINVLVVLAIGLALCAGIGFADGMSWTGFLGSVGEGIAGMGDLIIVTMLAGGMLEMIRQNGGIDFIIKGLTKGIKGRRGAEFSIAGLVGLSDFCTANNTIAILTTGNIAKDISKRFGVDPRKSASILDTFSCVVQGIIPYGAQLLMA
ncbi:MAG: Na+/H+ antiporter NhaC family protein, partial [Bacteroidales bacterium]|nr:Na+/H+ antiporter NhaC family protein [Bacteroidales bacterium]